MQTYMAKPHEVQRDWVVIDAEGKTLGRLATEVANLIRGKYKPQFTPHVDTGDFVIVINAEKIELTGKKLQQKIYYHHSRYPGGLKEKVAGELRENNPEKMIEFAVRGMLPKNRLGKRLFTKLFVYRGSEHPHQAQQPKVWEIRQ